MATETFRSKKFVAYLVAELGWKIILGAMLYAFRDEVTLAGATAWWVMLVIVVVAGFVEVAYIAGQAALDRYVKVAEVALSKGKTPPEPPES